jgi:hypothetical protein
LAIYYIKYTFFVFPTSFQKNRFLDIYFCPFFENENTFGITKNVNLQVLNCDHKKN